MKKPISVMVDAFAQLGFPVGFERYSRLLVSLAGHNEVLGVFVKADNFLGVCLDSTVNGF